MLKSNKKMLAIASISLLSSSAFINQFNFSYAANVTQENDNIESYIDLNDTGNLVEMSQSVEINIADLTKDGNGNDTKDERIGTYNLALPGVLGMSNNSEAKTVDDNVIKAWVDVEQKNGYLHIQPTIEWLLTVTASEASKFRYHLSVIKDGVGGRNNTSQKGGIPLKSLNQHVSLSSTQVNYSSEDNYEFSLKIYRNDLLIASTSKSW